MKGCWTGCCRCCAGMWTPSNNGSFSPPESIPQMASRSVQPIFQGSRSLQTDRQTDQFRPRYCICSNRPHLACAAMQLKLTGHKWLMAISTNAYQCCHHCFNFWRQHNTAEKDSTEQKQCVHHACTRRLFHSRQTTAAQAARVWAAATCHLHATHSLHYCSFTASSN